MTTEQPPEPRDDALAAEETAAAAAEAAAIGGAGSEEDRDPASRPVYEAGGGEEEGFEAAEDALRDNAEHGDGTGDPAADAFTPEVESDRSDAEYAEADELDSPDA